ncbi:DUF3526 domain-containing protein [Shewanella sp. WXL01]|nr:DUF3526 domain-containing protein [Shewanella sp. WXL01]NKF50815.1 DUF3526 domain-containing protein [Shewanella sp. WXL01]
MSYLAHIKRETRFLFKQRYVLAILSIVFSLSVFAVWSGIVESQAQSKTIERLIEKDAQERAHILTKKSDYGSAGYYSFHLTYSEPSSAAFAAIGQRDIHPWKHRIRLLALEGQIYETDAANPELSFVGRFDFAFLASVLLPLFVILLLHDMRAAERSSGRYDLLISTAGSWKHLWLARALVLTSALMLALILPLLAGALWSQTPIKLTASMALVVIGHLVFWSLMVLWYTASSFAQKQTSAQIASVLLSAWLAVTVLVPVASDMAINHMIDSPNGGDIVLTQREAVNDAWDLPAKETWDVFLTDYPQWRELATKPPEKGFNWKWYYAFQHVGDLKTHELSQGFRDAKIAKDTLAGRFALLSPPMFTQRLIASIAQTDTQAAVAYEQSVRDYHQTMRHFYYLRLFGEAEFDQQEMAKLPEFSHL